MDVDPPLTHKECVPLFRSKIVRDALIAYDRPPTDEEIAAAAGWAARAMDPGMDLQNESQLEQEFNKIIVQQVLGYRASAPGMAGTMRVKQPVPGGTTVDLALGEFGEDRSIILAPFELKGPKTRLDRIMPGRNKTPVQQAWDYATDAPGARWVLVSDMREVRLYAFGYGRQDYEAFDLRKIGDLDELRRFQMLLGADRLLPGVTRELLTRSAAADRDITVSLYRDYREVRDDLLLFVDNQASDIPALKRIELVQRLLDRLLFVAFAEDSFLLPENSLRGAIDFHNPYDPRPKWDQVKRLFEWVDVGASAHNIPPYNGGLFRTEPQLDAIAFPDHLVERFALLSQYDFRSEVSVTILGHIFEQSITDIEELRAGTRGEAPVKAGKRKREGVVYTPEFITRFIVERTIGKHLSDIAAALVPAHGIADANGEIKWKSKAAEVAYWNAYLQKLAALRIVDPACGSGAFLIAAFDHLHIEQERVRLRLLELGAMLLGDTPVPGDIAIITNNLYGVDVNAESIELTKLALWLKTAKRNRPLEGLNGTIKEGNSLVAAQVDGAPGKPFDWHAAFPTIFDGSENAGFDIVLGNPPYVRMEHLKAIKPYLAERYAVAADRADLYAYFFELGVELMRPGGRMGYVSSSTFFRTGSGAPLRRMLSKRATIEAVVDFGDLQVFEGVTTYPAIVTLRKAPPGDTAALSHLTVRALPEDLSKTFEEEARTMPQTRLGAGTWRFESDLLDAIRAKMASDRLTLAEAFGAPLRGVVTGLNDAFILTRKERDALVAREAWSAELLKPFVVGENCRRWRVERGDLWLIYTPKNRVDIEDYPAVRDHLRPWQRRLEARATKQEWWELQQAQAAYEPAFQAAKIVYSDITNEGSFSVDRSGSYLANTSYFVADGHAGLCGYLNSKLAWFYFLGRTNIARGGYLRLRTDFVQGLPVPASAGLETLAELAGAASNHACALYQLKTATRKRLADLGSAIADIDAFLDWPSLSFAELRALLTKRCKVTIPVGERDEWEEWFDARKSEASALSARIAEAEAEIDVRVYRLFDLSPIEIAAVEDALALAAPGLSLRAYEAVSAVEGLALSDDGRARVTGPGSTSDRRAEVRRAHAA